MELTEFLKQPRTRLFSADLPKYKLNGVGQAKFGVIRENLKKLTLDKKSKMLILPFDQRLETGGHDFAKIPHAYNPEFEYALAIEAKIPIVLQPGSAFNVMYSSAIINEFGADFEKPPLVVKINGAHRLAEKGKTRSYYQCSIETAAKIGATAIGWTYFYGSDNHGENTELLNHAIEESHKYGLPIIVWCYPRGEMMEKGGGESFWNIADAVAQAVDGGDMGADIVKVSFPKGYDEVTKGIEDSEKKIEKWRNVAPKEYHEMQISADQGLRWIIEAAGYAGVIVSGGEKKEGDALKQNIASTIKIMQSGADGRIIGRNVFKNSPLDAMLFLEEHKREILSNGYKMPSESEIKERADRISRIIGYK